MRTLQFYSNTKKQLKRQAAIEQNPEYRLILLKACDYCDKKMMQILRSMVITVNILVLASILFVTGCKATAGLGRDITWVGEAGEKMLQYESRNK